MESIRDNVTATIKRLKREGTTGMGLANLMQITPTKGVTIAAGLYRQEFERITKETAKALRFTIY